MGLITFGDNNAQYQPINQIGSIRAQQQAADQASQLTATNALATASLQSQAANADQLSKLQESSWAGIAFPNTGVVDDISFDLAIHKYPGLDGGFVENTGRNPGVFHIIGVFSNHIYPASGETWKYGSLYPAVLSRSIISC